MQRFAITGKYAVTAVAALVVSLAAAGTATASVPRVSIPMLPRAPAMNGAVDASWADAASVRLEWDAQYNRPAGAVHTTVRFGRFGNVLYVAFENSTASQPVVTQHTDGSGVYGDDNDQVLLWPDGSAGFAYSFTANALGTHYQTSSENTSYAPAWTAIGRQMTNGFVTQMAIPLTVMRSRGSSSWRMQFARVDVSTGSVYEWAHDPSAQSAADVLYAAEVEGLRDGSSAARPPPRVQVYGLAQAGARSAGGDTSRIGADLAVPVTRTSSVIASFHPDYSNVEIDQQTIAPTEFPRQYREVRPFFTQGANFYNTTRCVLCPYQILYTPAIPAFRDGFAVEGQQGLFGFGAFDAQATNRNDQAQSFVYKPRNQSVDVEAERVATSVAGRYNDVVTMYGAGYTNPHSRLAFFTNYGADRGTAGSTRWSGTYQDVGASLRSLTSSVAVTLRKMGQGFNPLDGYVANNDIAGWAASGSKVLSFPARSIVQDVSASAFADRYHDHTGRVNEDDAGYQVNVDFRNKLSLHAFQNNDYLLTGSGEYLPFSENGVYLGYLTRTSTPSAIYFITGPFYHGRQSYASYASALRVHKSVTMALEIDRSAYAPDAAHNATETSTVQWLERVAFDWQPIRAASVDVGLRRIRGFSPPASYAPPSTALTNATNVTAAVHLLRRSYEWYLVYGDPNKLYTKPALTLKLIRYFGAAKGT